MWVLKGFPLAAVRIIEKRKQKGTGASSDDRWTLVFRW